MDQYEMDQLEAAQRWQYRRIAQVEAYLATVHVQETAILHQISGFGTTELEVRLLRERLAWLDPPVTPN
jgi:hypothetical protein